MLSPPNRADLLIVIANYRLLYLGSLHMGDRKKQTKEKMPSRMPIEPGVVIHDGETTNRLGETDDKSKESGQETNKLSVSTKPSKMTLLQWPDLWVQ